MEKYFSQNDLVRPTYTYGHQQSTSCIACSNFNPNIYSSGSFTEIAAIPKISMFLPNDNNKPSSETSWLPGLACLTCDGCVAISKFVENNQDDKPHLDDGNSCFICVEDILTSCNEYKDGWRLADTEEDLYRHLVLNYVVYRVNEPPSRDNYESNYGTPLPRLDKVFLLWDKGRAVGFATTREWDEHSMIIIDTIFIRASHRRQGHAKTFIQQLLNAPGILMSHYTQEKYNRCRHLLGFSSPISTGMLGLLIRMLVTDIRQTPRKSSYENAWKDRVLLIIGDGTNDEVQNFWWSAPKLARERKLDLKRFFSDN